MKRQDAAFHKLIATVEENDIFGIVGAGGAGGIGSGDEDRRRLILHLAAWKHQTDDLRHQELRVEMPVSEEALDRFMSEIRPYDMVHLRGRVAQHPNGRMQAAVTEIVSRVHRDSDLLQYVAELQKPVIYRDPELGEFLLDRSINWFQTEVAWHGRSIRLDLVADSVAEIDDPLITLKTLWRNLDDWTAKVDDYAVDALLERKNSTWLDEDESEVTPDEFKSRMQLESITVYPSGLFEFWHNDGDLFWGHSIQVRGNLRDGLTHVDTPG
jgi:hypothetical protein